LWFWWVRDVMLGVSMINRRERSKEWLERKVINRAVILISLKCFDSMCHGIMATVRRWRRSNLSDKRRSLRLSALATRAVSGVDFSLRNIVSGAGMKAHPRLTGWQTRGKKLTSLAYGTKGVSDPVRIPTLTM